MTYLSDLREYILGMGVTWFRLTASLFIPSVSDNNTTSFLAMIQVSLCLKNRYS